MILVPLACIPPRGLWGAASYDNYYSRKFTTKIIPDIGQKVSEPSGKAAELNKYRGTRC